MVRKYILPLVAVTGVVFSIWLAMSSARPVPYSQPISQPPQAPFPSFVAGAGIIESSTENIAIATPVSGVVKEVAVRVGMEVADGDPLFSLDDRDLRAELAVRRRELQVAEQKLERLRSLPRPEEVPPAEARVKEAQAQLADARNLFALAERVTDKRAISKEEVDRRRFAVQVAETRLVQERANLDLLKAGTWRPDIEVAASEVEQARARVEAIKTDIERLTVRAPVDGRVLQVNIRSGEFAQAGVLQTPLMLLGSVAPLHVRVDVDENDAWRIRWDSPATAYVRGNSRLSTPLRFVHIEPYIVPKRSLTGESTERVDTRVLQIIYSFPRGNLPVYVGQQMDVYIEAPSIEGATATLLSKNEDRGGGTVP